MRMLQEKVEQNRHVRPLGWAVAKLMELALLLNNFVFNGINFLQIKGTSMGGKMLSKLTKENKKGVAQEERNFLAKNARCLHPQRS